MLVSLKSMAHSFWWHFFTLKLPTQSLSFAIYIFSHSTHSWVNLTNTESAFAAPEWGPDPFRVLRANYHQFTWQYLHSYTCLNILNHQMSSTKLSTTVHKVSATAIHISKPAVDHKFQVVKSGLRLFGIKTASCTKVNITQLHFMTQVNKVMQRTILFLLLMIKL